MRIVDKYILSRTVRVYVFVFLIFAGLYFIIDLFSHLEDFLDTDPPIGILLQYYLNMLPLIFMRVSPFALLTSVLYTFGELNKHNEMVTLRASGISSFKIAFPAVFLAVLISSGAFFLQEKVLISTQKTVEDISLRYIKKKDLSSHEIKQFPFVAGNKIFLVEHFSALDEKMEKVIVFQEGNGGNIDRQLLCREIIYQNGSWIGSDIIEYTFDDEGSRRDPVRWQEKKIPLEESPQELLFKKSIFLQFVPLKELYQKIQSLKKIHTEAKLNPLIVDFHYKLVNPWAHFFLILGTLPLALEIRKRKVGLLSLGIGFLFFFLYYVLSFMSMALGKEGIIIPSLSAWLAPLFFLTMGITGLFSSR
ncbi:MAG: LptF/LptG family permease [Candidatus Omnitrophica bacterium]|nr:LptF/LptG family permease [Candidatus Omnitrophota bacterium]